ncbi:uncharacterized protein LOC135470338 [Liolophura sinensis]|uniref:uncharacterized protein LOC135470338 n=1 Tax=Liolophura sinensis TaxID=3198878 RepID=UPI0031589000
MTMDGHVQKRILLMCLTFSVLTDCAVIVTKDQEKPVDVQADKLGEKDVTPLILRKFPSEPSWSKNEYRSNWQTTAKVPSFRVPPKLVKAPGAKELTAPVKLSPIHKVPLFQAAAARVSPAGPSLPKLQPVETEEEALIRRQEWAEANEPHPKATQKMDESGISAIVHDPRTGDRGVTALKDVDRNACFINHYFEPFVLPSSQREFYARNLPATIIESDDEQEQFQKCVGAAVAKHCQDAKTYWLDKNLFFQFVDSSRGPQKRSRPSDSTPSHVNKITDIPMNRERRHAQTNCTCNTGSQALLPKIDGLSDLVEARTINPLLMIPTINWLIKERLPQWPIPKGPIPRGPIPIGPNSPYAKASLQKNLQSKQLLQGK